MKQLTKRIKIIIQNVSTDEFNLISKYDMWILKLTTHLYEVHIITCSYQDITFKQPK